MISLSAKVDDTVTRMHVHGLDEASLQLAPFMQVRYVQLQRGGACFHGAVGKLGNALIGHAGADRDKVEFIEVPRGTTLVIVPTRGLARVGTTCVAPGHALVAHGPTQLIAYTDREYRVLFASLADRWSELLMSSSSVAQRSVQASAQVCVLRLSEIDSRLFHRYVNGGLREAPVQRGCSGYNRLTRLPATERPLVNLCDSWLKELGSRESTTGLSTARCQAAIRARKYIDEHLDQPLSLASVCHASYSSPRALEYGFREIFGVSPITYIRCARLSRVRRELRLSTQIHGRVTQLAMKWGFWHLSQFSSDYYDLFGELPSTTLGRAAARLGRSEDAREVAQVPSSSHCAFDGGNDLVRRAGFHQHGVEEL